jgi:hypothetical protein
VVQGYIQLSPFLSFSSLVIPSGMLGAQCGMQFMQQRCLLRSDDRSFLIKILKLVPHNPPYDVLIGTARASVDEVAWNYFQLS